MANITIGTMDFQKTSDLEVEIVERKGVGHPDTICDSLSEELSIALSKLYRDKLGAIMHHNVDKALLIGGTAKPAFKGGEITSPIEIYLTGRALDEVKGVELNVQGLAMEVANDWLGKYIPNLDLTKHVDIAPKLKKGSPDLVDLFERFQTKGEVPLSNDTSFGVGYAPFSDIEKVVYEIENTLNGAETKKNHPYVGEDIKVMGVRIGNTINITIALAFVDKYVDSVEDYVAKRKLLEKLALEVGQKNTKLEVKISINMADDPDNGSVYITVTGTSSEAGDDGQVGRGNRVNGLITPYRPMTLEAAAGKNPVSHVGKIYNRSAFEIAKRIVDEVPEVEEAYVYLVSQIGKPINEPQVADIKLRTKSDIKGIEEVVKKIVNEEIEDLPNIWKRFLEREFRLY